MVSTPQDDARIPAADVHPSVSRDYHDEVARALTAISNPELGQAIRRDRGSELEHLGIRFPELLVSC